MVPWVLVLIHSLGVWVIILLVVAHVIYKVIRVLCSILWIVFVSLTWVFKLSYFKCLLYKYIFYIIWQIVNFIFSLLLILLFILGLSYDFAFQIFNLYFVKKAKFRFTNNSFWFLWIFAVWVLIVIVSHVIVILLTFLGF